MQENQRQKQENDMDGAELFSKLKASLEAAYHGKMTPEAEEYYHWGESFLGLSESGPLEDPPSREELYVAAVNTLQAQVLHGAPRPSLARRIILDPEAFFMALATALRRWDRRN
jgi:hypothetical protein